MFLYLCGGGIITIMGSLKSKEYVQHSRRPVPDKTALISVHDTMPTGADAPPQHVILDENVQA